MILETPIDSLTNTKRKTNSRNKNKNFCLNAFSDFSSSPVEFFITKKSSSKCFSC